MPDPGRQPRGPVRPGRCRRSAGGRCPGRAGSRCRPAPGALRRGPSTIVPTCGCSVAVNPRSAARAATRSRLDSRSDQPSASSSGTGVVALLAGRGGQHEHRAAVAERVQGPVDSPSRPLVHAAPPARSRPRRSARARPAAVIAGPDRSAGSRPARTPSPSAPPPPSRPAPGRRAAGNPIPVPRTRPRRSAPPRLAPSSAAPPSSLLSFYWRTSATSTGWWRCRDSSHASAT